jgi:hypothetical protein
MLAKYRTAGKRSRGAIGESVQGIMTEEKKPLNEWERFNKVMDGLLAVPYAEVKKELEKEQKRKAKKKRLKKAASREAGDS